MSDSVQSVQQANNALNLKPSPSGIKKQAEVPMAQGTRHRIARYVEPQNATRHHGKTMAI
jgi:hypothetical protein